MPGHARRSKTGRTSCGLIALTVVTGKPYEELERLVQTNRSSSARADLTRDGFFLTFPKTSTRPVGSMFPQEVFDVLHDLGFRGKRTFVGDKLKDELFPDYVYPRIQAFVERVAMKDPDAFYIVWSSTHFYTVKGSRVWDVTHATSADGNHYRRMKRGIRQSVIGWLRIEGDDR